MPASPNLPTNRAAGTTGHIADTNTAHAAINSMYKRPVGTTRTSAYTLTQANSGEVIPVNSSSAVAITAPTLEQGTQLWLVRLGTGAVTITASGTTLVLPAGKSASCRVQGSTIRLTWLTTTQISIAEDVT